MDKAIEWFEQRQGKVTYSMINRNGPNSYDCSSAIYHSLIYAGILPQGFRIGNTETMFVDLPKFGFRRIEADANGYIPTQRGDIFIWGKQGYTAGANGHTGLYYSSDDIIHCAYAYNGIHSDNHDWLAGINNVQYLTIFRYTGKPQNAPAPAPRNEIIDDVINIGSHFKISQALQVSGVNVNEGRRELKIDALCPRGFTWAENGIPADWAVKVDGDGYKVDGEINYGDFVKLQGVFTAKEVVQNDEMWFASVERNGITVWMELTPVTEVPAGDKGTITEYRPAPAPQPAPAPVEEPKPEIKEEPKPEVKEETPEVREEKSETKEDKPEIKEEPKEEKVAETKPTLPKINERPFTEKELKMLEESKKEAVEAVEALNQDEQFNELKELIPKPVRLGLYLFGDLLLIGSAVIASYGIGYTQAGLTGGIVGALSAGGAGIIATAKLTKKK